MVSSGMAGEAVAAKLGTVAPLSIFAGGATDAAATRRWTDRCGRSLDSRVHESDGTALGSGVNVEADRSMIDLGLWVRSPDGRCWPTQELLDAVDGAMAADVHALPAVAAVEDVLAPRCRAKGRRRR